jgi:hypothetical protein
MRARLLEILAVALLLAGGYFFYVCLRHLTDRDYVGSILIMFIGISLLRVGSDMAKLSLWDGRE